MSTTIEPKLSSLAHGGGCGCKISPSILSEILKSNILSLNSLPIPKNLLVGLETSDDAAIYQLNTTQAIIATTDFFTPIVDDPFDFGAIAATNALSDVYAMGGLPIFALALLGMPIKILSTTTISRIMDGARTICARAGIIIVGGHSIDTTEPIFGLVAIGIIHPEKILRNSTAKPNDIVILGKALGVGIFSAALKKDSLGEEGYKQMLESTTLLNTPGSELANLLNANGKQIVTSLTDVTGFGLAGHTLEMAKGSGYVVEIEWKRVPVFPLARELANQGFITGASGRNWSSYGHEVQEPSNEWNEIDRALLCDPQTSGGLLVTCAEEDADTVLTIFSKAGFVYASKIGRVLNEPTKSDNEKCALRII
jgi:selenide, water dikinase